MALTDEDKAWLNDRLHGLETKLLRAFSDYYSGAGIGMRKLEADASNLNVSSTMRLGELERQMTDVTRRLIFSRTGLDETCPSCARFRFGKVKPEHRV